MRIALTGNPNSGKTTMYNALTGRNEKVGNWAGVTVDKKEAPIKKNYTGGAELIAVDLPGAYSMSPFTSEESITSAYVKNERPDAIINIVDATNLSRSLFFTTQLLELGVPVVVALNKADVNKKKETRIDTAALSAALNCPVIETVSTNASGLDKVVKAAAELNGRGQKAPYSQGYVDLTDKLSVVQADRERFAFVNELAMVFDRMGIDTNEVIDGMNTKWNALGFRPGLVGGHCIGVDPYYFTYQAEKLGYHSQIILNGRIINDSMGRFVADAAIKKMILCGQTPKKAKVVILGITFKENCPDTRNSKVNDIILRLQEYGITPIVADPCADSAEALREYGVTLTPMEDIHDADCIFVAVAHKEFRALTMDDFKKMFKADADTGRVLIDVKGLYRIEDMEAAGMTWWRL